MGEVDRAKGSSGRGTRRREAVTSLMRRVRGQGDSSRRVFWMDRSINGSGEAEASSPAWKVVGSYLTNSGSGEGKGISGRE